MAYQKQVFIDNKTVIQAKHFKHIENGIVTIEQIAENANWTANMASNNATVAKAVASNAQTIAKGKQDKLVSGKTIKTVNGQTLLGDGDLNLAGMTDCFFLFEQEMASAKWTITHPLNKFPSVSVVDSSGNEVLGEVIYINDSTIQIEFIGAFSGKAYLN